MLLVDTRMHVEKEDGIRQHHGRTWQFLLVRQLERCFIMYSIAEEERWGTLMYGRNDMIFPGASAREGIEHRRLTTIRT